MYPLGNILFVGPDVVPVKYWCQFMVVCMASCGCLMHEHVCVCVRARTGDICSALLLASPPAGLSRTGTEGTAKVCRGAGGGIAWMLTCNNLAESTAEVCVMRSELKNHCKKLFACTCYALCCVKKAKEAKLH